MPVRIKVTFCGVWNYWPKYEKLQVDLQDQFSDLEFEGIPTPQRSGLFEVEINGKLVHSKKNGDGHVDNEEKLYKICNAVEAALKEAGN